MHKISTLNNGLTLITVDLPRLESVTSMVAVGAGSRYETKNINGISHFLEHMFFKGSRKYPSAEQIATMIDSIGAVNNAATDKEVTYYWIKSAAKHLELSSDILSSMIRESLLSEFEIEKEKGVITEELRMYRDNPSQNVFNLYESLQYGNQPIGWDIGGSEKTINKFEREDFVRYLDSLYSPANMAIIYVGKLPGNIKNLAESFYLDLPKRAQKEFTPFKKIKQLKPKVSISYKETDQVNCVLGVEAYARNEDKKYAETILATILGEGMSSRLFVQVREKRGLAYHISANASMYKDTGSFIVYGGIKLEKFYEALEVIKAELYRITSEKVTNDELNKAKELIRGRLAIRAESTNFLAEYFGIKFVLDRKIESFEEYMKKIVLVTKEEIQEVAKELFRKEKFNLQIIGPLKNSDKLTSFLERS
jgi:predicted Zn-dependent peptidase